MFNRLGLIGCGLMGGSLSLALQRAQLVKQVVGYSTSQHTLEVAYRNGVIHAAAPSAAETAASADLIVIAVPVAATGKVLQSIGMYLRDGAVVMDVGSTKQNVVDAATSALGSRLGQFVPAHPIAGKEVAGIEHAEADLYRGKQVILTPPRRTQLGALQQITAMWEALDCRVQTMTPQAHDAAFAAISHLPHMAAFALMHSILQQNDAADILALAGSGFRDFSRIAASDPAIWRDIFLCNRDEMLRQTDMLVQALQTFATCIANNDAQRLQNLIAQASQARSQWHMATKDNNSLP